MQAMEADAQANDNIEVVARMQLDLVALAFACELTHSATLQVGDGNDSTQYIVDGQKLPSFHQISHRIYSDGSEGDPIPGADLMHSEIDRILVTSTITPDLTGPDEIVSVVRASDLEPLGKIRMSDAESPSKVAPVEVLGQRSVSVKTLGQGHYETAIQKHAIHVQ